MSWNQEKISDVAIIGDGAHASIKRAETGVPYLTSKNFKAEGLDLTKLDFISEPDYQKHFKEKSKALTKPQEDDLVVGIIGTLGSPYLVRKTDRFGLSSSVAILRPNSKKILPKYLLYWMKSSTFQHSINQIKSGVAQSFLSLGMIGSLPVSYPQSLDIQYKIAGILATYDDLIENNLKRIKLLEEMAQITYEEWFVRLRFPGHESTSINPETGLPEGWETKAISTVCDVNKNSITARNAPETIRYIDIASAETGYYTTPQEMPFSEAPSRARRRVAFGDTIFSTVRPNRRIFSLVLENDPLLVASTGFAVLTPHRAQNFPFIYITIAQQSFTDAAVAVAGGAAYPAVNQTDFERIKITVPTQELMNKFSDAFAPNFTIKGQLQRENALLREARDILLPRLMTGVIDVESYDPTQLLKEAA